MDDEIKEILIRELCKGENQDSVEVGNSKTGVVKVYFNALKPDEARNKIQNAIELLEVARPKVYGNLEGKI